MGSEKQVVGLGAVATSALSLSQQKGIPCHLCQMAVSVVGKILQDNRTEVGHSLAWSVGLACHLHTSGGHPFLSSPLVT